MIRVQQESRVTPSWLGEWLCHSPREGTEEDDEVSLVKFELPLGYGDENFQ